MQGSTNRCTHLQVDAAKSLYVDASWTALSIYIYMLSLSPTIRSSKPNAITRSYRNTQTPCCGFHFPPAPFTCRRTSTSDTATRPCTTLSAERWDVGGAHSFFSPIHSTVLHRFLRCS